MLPVSCGAQPSAPIQSRSDGPDALARILFKVAPTAVSSSIPQCIVNLGVANVHGTEGQQLFLLTTVEGTDSNCLGDGHK